MITRTKPWNEFGLKKTRTIFGFLNMFRQTLFCKLACCTRFRCRPLWTNNAILMQFDIYNLLKLVNIDLWLEAPSLTVWAYQSNTDIFTKDVIHSLNEWFNYRGVCRYICLNICVFCLKLVEICNRGKSRFKNILDSVLMDI